MVISLAIGYMAAPAVISNTPSKQSGMATFFASAAAIALTLHDIDLIKIIELPRGCTKAAAITLPNGKVMVLGTFQMIIRP